MGNHISLLSASSGRVATAQVIFARASLFWLTLAVSGVRRSEVPHAVESTRRTSALLAVVGP
jgi:hypothetical protein